MYVTQVDINLKLCFMEQNHCFSYIYTMNCFWEIFFELVNIYCAKHPSLKPTNFCEILEEKRWNVDENDTINDLSNL